MEKERLVELNVTNNAGLVEVKESEFDNGQCEERKSNRIEERERS